MFISVPTIPSAPSFVLMKVVKNCIAVRMEKCRSNRDSPRAKITNGSVTEWRTCFFGLNLWRASAMFA